ncbi:MAG: ATP-binding protein [Planctomycetes bacterium]|nr:ATP-binding protein [Planctomycetota bacterium]
MIHRELHLKAVHAALAHNPICAILGPRQCGKTTLARQVGQLKASHYFDLETAVGRTRLADPDLALTPLKGLIVIDEIQRLPELFTALRPLADRRPRPARFLILGSASPEVVRGASESLAGRIAFVDLGPFDLREVGIAKQRRLWQRGGFPRSFLARSATLSFDWRQDFIRTFLERDIPQLGIRIPADTLRRFWMMVAHYHAQIWNGAELARSLSVTEHTARSYLDLLTATFLLRQLPPWFENLGKRQYKAPKVYVRDSGLLHALLALQNHADLLGHPKYGASWEGFALEQVLSITGAAQAFFWGTHAGAELDLLLIRRGKRFGVEFKASAAPAMTKSLHVALGDLRLAQAWIVHPGEETYRIHERVEAIALRDVPAAFDRLAV